MYSNLFNGLVWNSHKGLGLYFSWHGRRKRWQVHVQLLSSVQFCSVNNLTWVSWGFFISTQYCIWVTENMLFTLYKCQEINWGQSKAKEITSEQVWWCSDNYVYRDTFFIRIQCPDAYSNAYSIKPTLDTHLQSKFMIRVLAVHAIMHVFYGSEIINHCYKWGHLNETEL